jgi:putative sigma-54 modulation protein
MERDALYFILFDSLLGRYGGGVGKRSIGGAMQLEIRIKKIDIPKAVHHYIERRLRFSLSRFERRIRRVNVRIFDLNGPRGGADKCCRIAILLASSDPVVVQEVNTDLFTAIDRAAERAGQKLARRLHRARDLRTQRESVRVVAESVERSRADQRAA